MMVEPLLKFINFKGYSNKAYTNKAMDYYNRYQSRIILEEKLTEESCRTREESLNVLREFESFELKDL
jgi:hypothetical protein